MQRSFAPWRKDTRMDFSKAAFEVKDRTKALQTSQATQHASLTEPKFQGRVGKRSVARAVSVLETKGLASQSRQPEAPGPGKALPPSEQAPLTTLLRLARMSPIPRLAKAGEDFSFFFPPQQKAHLPGPKSRTAKGSFDKRCF